MRKFDNFRDVAIHANVKDYEVEKAFERFVGCSYIVVNDFEFQMVDGGDRINFIYLENEIDKNKFIMEYEIDTYNWKVYVDDIEGWQKCKVISIQNEDLNIRRAVVETELGTRLNRIAKYALDEEDVSPNGCIYFIEKYLDDNEVQNSNAC